MSERNCTGCTHAFQMRINEKDGKIARMECWLNPPTPFFMGVDPSGMPNVVSTYPPVTEHVCCSHWKEGFPRLKVVEVPMVQPATVLDMPPGARRDN